MSEPRTSAAPGPALGWLLDADPAIRWQVLRDLTDAPAHEVQSERDRVATQGWGARLLASQGPDGRWGGAAWNRGWDSTMHVLVLLRELGLDPASAPARRAVGRVADHVTWRGAGPPECDDNRFFEGELEPCINAQVAAAGAYFHQDVGGIVDRLLGEQLGDGGWNCEAPGASRRSSFNTTICVLEALLQHERATGGSPRIAEARARGQAYLLERGLFRRRSTGEAIERDRKGGAAWSRFAFPTWWHYDVLRGLEYLRSAGVAPDERAAEAIAMVASKRDGDGRWPLEARHPGAMPIDFDEHEGGPSRWNTLRALRVLDWFSAGERGGWRRLRLDVRVPETNDLVGRAAGRARYDGRRAPTAPTRRHPMKVTIETTVAAPIEAVWRAWTTPDDIVRWNAASEDWHTTAAAVDLRVGGAFSSRMEAKDGSQGFDFAGIYSEVVPHERIAYAMDDGREVVVEFAAEGELVRVRETFDAEATNPVEMQRQGWQAILDSFARHVEATRSA